MQWFGPLIAQAIEYVFALRQKMLLVMDEQQAIADYVFASKEK